MKKRLVVYGLGAAVLVAALLALAVALIDSPAVQAELRARLSQALDGQVTWEALELDLLPAPRAELRKVRVEIPQKLTAAADEVKVYLRLWPLLRGSPQISSVTLARPQVRITLEKDNSTPADPLALYRAAAGPAVDALREYAPDMTLRLERGALDLGAFQLQDLSASARTGSSAVDFKAAARSNFWKQLSIDGRIEYAELAARADIALDALVVDPAVPPATLRAKARTDAKTAIECEFDARLGTLATVQGKAMSLVGKPIQFSAQLHALDVAQALAIARRKVEGLDLIESAEGRVSTKVDFSLASPWQLDLRIVKSDAAVKLAALPWKLAPHAARLTITPGHVRVAGAKGVLGDSAFENVAAHVDLRKTARLSAASGNATLQLEQWFPWLRAKVPLDEVSALSGSVEVALTRLALRFDRPQEADYEAAATPRNVSAALKALPAPVNVTHGVIHVNSRQVRLEKVAAAMLDARARVSGSFSFAKSSLDISLADGAVGEKLVRWAMQRADVADRLEPKTPLRLSAQRIAWAPKGALEVDARVEFERGPTLALALAWRPELLELRRVAIKDERSDALLDATVAGDLIQASFTGTLHGQSIPSMLRQPLPAASGTARGELRLTIDRKRPERTSGEGHLRVEALDLSWLAGRKALIERAEIDAEGTGMRISAARFGVEDQFFELSGEARRTDQGPVLDARIESAGVILDRLLPPVDPNAPKKKASPLWPLPVSGRIDLRTGFVQYKTYRIEPFGGIVSLEPERARLEVKEARMCGLSFPMEVEMRPEQGIATAHIRMQDEPLERTVRCLTGGNVELTGNANLTAELRVQGRRPHLVRGLTGTLQADVREGEVKRFALLGNILSFRNIVSPGRMKQDGFPYRHMTAKGRFESGTFLVEEAFFDSDAIRLAAHGRVGLLEPNSQLTVLVGLLTNVDRIAEVVPILGDVFGGSMSGLPISVSGDIRDPRIIPLGPRAVTDQLLGIFERTLRLPGKLLLHPEAKPQAQ
jgi:hypothetical protein